MEAYAYIITPAGPLPPPLLRDSRRCNVMVFDGNKAAGRAGMRGGAGAGEAGETLHGHTCKNLAKEGGRSAGKKKKPCRDYVSYRQKIAPILQGVLL